MPRHSLHGPSHGECIASADVAESVPGIAGVRGGKRGRSAAGNDESRGTKADVIPPGDANPFRKPALS